MIQSCWSVQPRRATAVVSGEGVPPTDPKKYALSRSDGGPSSITILLAFLTGANTVELELSAPLMTGVVYLLLVNDGGFQEAGANLLVYNQPPDNFAQLDIEDAEAESLGDDCNWITDQLDAGGDVPRLRGADCFLADMEAIAGLEPGDIIHRPDAGGGLNSEVNGPTTQAEQNKVFARVQRAFLRDPRNQPGGIDLELVSDQLTGENEINATFRPVALGRALSLSTKGI